MGPRYLRVYHVARGHGSPVETRERWPNLGRTYHSIATQLSIITRREKNESAEKTENLMEVAKENSRKGASLGNIHARARCLFSWMDTSMLRERRWGSSLSTFAMSSSRA